LRTPSPIPFIYKVKKMDNSEWIKSDFLKNPDNPATKYFRQFSTFKDVLPEECIKWVMAFREIENLISMKETADKNRMFWTFLKDQALSYFEYHLKKKVEEEDSSVPEN
jgi:hypothetical protein